MEPKKAYSRMGFATFAYMLSWNIVTLLIVLVIRKINPNLVNYNLTIVLNAAVEIVVAAPLFYLIAKKAPVATEEAEISGNPAGLLFKSLFVMFGMGIIGSIIAATVNSIFSDNFNISSSSGLTDIFNYNFVLMSVYAVLIAPVIEEIIFRKLLIDRTVGYGKKLAMIMSGFLFGLMHGNIEQFFYTFFIGMIFAYVYIKTGRIWCSILLHMLLNGTSTVLQYCISKLPNLDDSEKLLETVLHDEKLAVMVVIMGAIVIVEYLGGFIGIIALICNKNNIGFAGPKVDVNELYESEETYSVATPQATTTDAFFNVGMIVAIFGLLVLMALSFIS